MQKGIDALKLLWKLIYKTPLFCPKGFIVRAGVLTFLFAILHFAGVREYTCVLSGVSATGGKVTLLSALLGGIYLFFYFGFFLATPVLIIGAAIFCVFQFVLSHYFIQKKLHLQASETDEIVDESGLA